MLFHKIGIRVMEWSPSEIKRRQGRPQTRWMDDLERVAGNWVQEAQLGQV